jgi:uncharacterized protein
MPRLRGGPADVPKMREPVAGHLPVQEKWARQSLSPTSNYYTRRDNGGEFLRRQTMLPLSYHSTKTEVRQSPIHGRGLFATADIAKDEIVVVKGGHIVDGETLRKEIMLHLGSVEIQIDDDLYIAPVNADERESSMLYSNHSCDANLGIRGEITFVAMRDIAAGKELTHDWCTTDNDIYSMKCNCGAPNCRGTLTGKDWQKVELREQYAGYFSAYLQKKIDQGG